MKRQRLWGTVFDRLVYTFKPFSERFTAVQVTRDEESGLFKADSRIWDGVKGYGGRTVHEYPTEQEAREAVQHIADQRPDKKRVIVIFDDDDEGKG